MINSQELYDAYREDVVDVALPYLWTEAEVYRYMDAAYRMFVRLTGGIADFTSDATRIDLSVGVDVYDISPSLLRVMTATRESDGAEVKVINNTDLPNLFAAGTDYGNLRSLMMTNKPGPVEWLILGQQRNTAKVIQIPMVADALLLNIYRLPLVNIVDGGHPLDEVAEDHHIYLLDWMKHLAYKKQDAETFDKTKSDEAEVAFRNYCAQCKAEWERYKHKTRVVAYGGL
jgi:hypothetical protein